MYIRTATRLGAVLFALTALLRPGTAPASNRGNLAWNVKVLGISFGAEGGPRVQQVREGQMLELLCRYRYEASRALISGEGLPPLLDIEISVDGHRLSTLRSYHPETRPGPGADQRTVTDKEFPARWNWTAQGVGDHVVRCRVDTSGKLQEGREDDNVAERTVRVVAGGEPRALVATRNTGQPMDPEVARLTRRVQELEAEKRALEASYASCQEKLEERPQCESDERSILPSTGARDECAPYSCNKVSGTCRLSCRSTYDCARGYFCYPDTQRCEKSRN